MALVFERILTEGIAEISYLIGDDSQATSAVVDPRADVEVYVELARKRNVSISHVFETHIHADLVSGARELAARTGTAKVYASLEGSAAYGFEVQPVRDGDVFEFGGVTFTARHTPGHTPEHMAYEMAESKRMPRPYGVFTGDSLFVNSAGRPDLLGKDADKLAGKLFDTLNQYYARLDPGVIIYPSHGHGSPCGAAIGDRLESTIGYELRFNPYYQRKERDAFVDFALSTAPPEPTYYKRMKKLNADGPPVIGHLPIVPALTAEAFKAAIEEGKGVLIDTRHLLAFGGGHITGALNIGASPMLTVWAGWLLDPDESIYLVLDKDEMVEEVAALFVRSGYTTFGGYLAGGMKSWSNAGLRLEETPQMTVHEVNTCSNQLQVLDVRSPEEWEGGHIPCAQHIFLPELRKKANGLDRERSVVAYCDSGYRASIAASLLRKDGFKDVRNMPGSWQAWMSAGFEIEK